MKSGWIATWLAITFAPSGPAGPVRADLGELAGGIMRGITGGLFVSRATAARRPAS